MPPSSPSKDWTRPSRVGRSLQLPQDCPHITLSTGGAGSLIPSSRDES